MGLEPQRKPRAFITIDYEDYRRQELRDHLRIEQPAHPQEVLKQTDLLLETLETLQLSATFFAVGRLVNDLPSSVWARICQQHTIGCHGCEHRRVDQLGPVDFKDDTRKAKAMLEDACGQEVYSYRAPYFSVDGCSPWYGQILAELGFKLDSSQRWPLHNTSAIPGGLIGSGNAVREVPLASIGVGPKRLTIIGGTYFRMLPTHVCLKLLSTAVAHGFDPVVYLHPYDLDPSAPPLAYPSSHLLPKMRDAMRRTGRSRAIDKLRRLCAHFDFQPVENMLRSRPTT